MSVAISWPWIIVDPKEQVDKDCMQIFEKTTDTRGMHNGYGFMRFDVAQTAELLHRLVHTVVPFDSAKIPKSYRVGAKVARRLIHAEQDRQVLKDAVKSEFTTVFVWGLDSDVTRDELRACFRQYGKITFISTPRDPESGSGKGFGFVKFLEHAEALKAVKGADGTMLKGQLLKVSPSQRKEDRQASLAVGYKQAREDIRKKETKQAKAASGSLSPTATGKQVEDGPSLLQGEKQGRSLRKGKSKRVFDDHSVA